MNAPSAGALVTESLVTEVTTTAGLSTAGGVVALIGIAVALAALVALHVLPTGLSPRRDPVSQYGITRYRALYATAAVSAAVAGVGGILVFTGIPGGVPTAVLLGLFSLARLIIPAVPMDAPGAPVTGRGRAHNVLAFAAFGAVTAAGFVAGGALHDAGYPATATASTAAGIVMAVGAVGLLLCALRPRLRGWFGAAERLIYLGFIAWFVLIGLTALG